MTRSRYQPPGTITGSAIPQQRSDSSKPLRFDRGPAVQEPHKPPSFRSSVLLGGAIDATVRTGKLQDRFFDPRMLLHHSPDQCAPDAFGYLTAGMLSDIFRGSVSAVTFPLDLVGYKFLGHHSPDRVFKQ